jgi:AraC family transcriptional regulator
LLQIELLPDRLAEISEHAAHLIPRRIDGDSGRQSWLANRVRSELQESDDLSPLAIEGLVLELFIEIWRRSDRPMPVRPPEWLKHANALIQERFSEKLVLDRIAGEVGVHSSHLSREFRRFYRRTIGERVRELRVEYARRELSRTYRPLADIAAAAGFCDQAHLSRTFRRLMGVTPERFRATTLPRKSGSNRA